MALTPSIMRELGTAAPPFLLPDVVTGKRVSLDGYKAKKALLVMFICRHCPYVQHIKLELAKLGRDYASKDIGIVGISSNDAADYPDDAPASLAAFAREIGLAVAFLYDETQEVARAYQAACTPDFFLYDERRRLVYRGQLDSSRPGSGTPVTGRDLRAAIDAVLAGRAPSADQKPSVGCNIKWKA